METAILKEPRGFMRILQWIFAILAFATCSHFSTYMQYSVVCQHNVTNATVVRHVATYPFNLGASHSVPVSCPGISPAPAQTFTQSPPGDFSSDAQFFVFTGVISFLSTMAILAVYVFFSSVYAGEDKKAPMIDFCFTVVMAVFWLSASAAWANGLIAMKSVMAGDWIFTDKNSACFKTAENRPFNTSVASCSVDYMGSYSGANVSVIFGFLNFFLWAANLWFLYKETTWFSGRAAQQQQTEG
jgi:hypothetical protein